MDLAAKPLHRLGTVRLDPPFGDQWALRDAIEDLCGEHGLKAFCVDIRDPQHRFGYLMAHDHPNLDITEQFGWHKDNAGARCYMGVWATARPTELLHPNGTVFKGRPYEFIVFDNAYFKHRCPQMSLRTAARRWFLRCFVEKGLNYTAVP